LTAVELQGPVEAAVITDAAALQDHTATAVAAQQILGMGGQHQGSGLLDELVEMAAGLALEPLITGGQPLIKGQSLHRPEGDQREGEAGAHAQRPGFDRRGQGVAEFGEGADLGEVVLPALLAGAMQLVAVAGQLQAAELLGEAQGLFDHRGQGRPMAFDPSACGAVDGAEQAQQGGFAAAVVAEQADAFARVDAQIELVKGEGPQAAGALAFQQHAAQGAALVLAAQIDAHLVQLHVGRVAGVGGCGPRLLLLVEVVFPQQAGVAAAAAFAGQLFAQLQPALRLQGQQLLAEGGRAIEQRAHGSQGGLGNLAQGVGLPHGLVQVLGGGQPVRGHTLELAGGLG